MASKVTLKSSIGAFPPSKHKELCRLLNIEKVWKELACVITCRGSQNPRFNIDDINTFELHPDPASRLLHTWSTDFVTFEQLISCLEKAGLERHASFVRNIFCTEQYSADVNSIPPPPDIQLRYVQLAVWTNNFNKHPAHQGGNFLGSGGYAEVFKGYDSVRQRLVAVKQLKLPPGVNLDGTHGPKQQFENEIRILSSCQHENIVTLFGFSTDGPNPCLIYEYMSQGSLEDRLACRNSSEPLSVVQRLAIARDTIRGLNYLHTEKQLFHMDVKSANILLNNAMRAKVGDYGITRQGPGNLATHIYTQNIIGTTVYMAPELLSSGKISPKVDAYSFGVVLLEMLTGLPALDNERDDPSLVEHIRESFQEGEIPTLDVKAGSWEVTDAEQIYEMATTLLKKYSSRPTISEITPTIEDWCRNL